MAVRNEARVRLLPLNGGELELVLSGTLKFLAEVYSVLRRLGLRPRPLRGEALVLYLPLRGGRLPPEWGLVRAAVAEAGGPLLPANPLRRRRG